jgi:serine phosphatase RsbU (regulator of sigma subunit)/tetratricopeptide (TPR) repeat protein
MKTFVFIFVVFALLPLNNSAQNSTIDSLWNIYNKTSSDSQRVEILIESIGYEYESYTSDSALAIYRMGLKMSQKATLPSAEARALMYIAILKMFSGDYDSSIFFFNQSANKFQTLCSSTDPKIVLKGKRGVAANYNNISNVYASRANYPEAIESLLKAAKIYEELNDTQSLAACFINIGGIQIHLKNIDIAEKYLSKALDYLSELEIKNPKDYNIKTSLIDVYVNLGVVNFEKKNLPKSKELYSTALALTESLNYKPKMASCLNNLGNIEFEMGRITEALKYYKKSLNVRNELGDVRGIALTKTNLSKIFLHLSQEPKISLDDKFRNIDLALSYGLEALSSSRELKSFILENEAAQRLMEAYATKGDFKKALDYSLIYIATKDSMFREEKTKALTEMETRYQTEKKQQEIEKQQLVISKQDVEMRRQRLQRNFFIVGSLLLGLLVLVVLRSYRQKQLSNRIITEKNALLEQANEEIAAQRDLVVEQKEHIEVIHEELTSSIRYARRIQGAVLPSAEQMNKLLSDHFVLFKPKDIVSGDFYWVTKVSSLTIFCVADCTGHGVPGAFMSMLGVSFLNDIVHKGHVTSAAEILNQLRESIIDALKQQGDGSEQKDGMDMGLCVIDTKTLQMQFAGGYNPCWIIPNLEHVGSRIIEPQSDNDASPEIPIIQLKPDKMPIAIHKHMESYTNHLLQLYTGDRVYLLSDGFQDQFGGSQGKKFMVKNLRDLLAANANRPMVEQQNLLEASLDEWMGGHEQVDDITILGVKV